MGAYTGGAAQVLDAAQRADHLHGSLASPGPVSVRLLLPYCCSGLTIAVSLMCFQRAFHAVRARVLSSR